MQTNKKTKHYPEFLPPSKTSDQAFDMAKSIQDVSRSGTLYGKLFAIKDMQIHLLQQEKMLKEQIEREENNE
jgi:hypothetical protein